MDPVQPTPITPVASPASSTGLFGTKIPASAAFLIAVLLFLLPFAEVKCNGAAMANNTGLGIATGSEWKEEVTKNIFGNSFNGFDSDQSEHRKEMEKQDPNKFAIAALTLGIIGLLISFLVSKSGGTANLIIGILAAVSLIAMLIDLRSKARSNNSVKSSDFDAGVSITVDGTSWCYLAIILFILGGIFCYMRGKTKPS